eukprot:757823-Hanusia_phi.AAC.6
MPNLPEVPLRLIRPSKSDENLPSQILMVSYPIGRTSSAKQFQDLEKAQQEGKLARDDMDEIQEGGEEVDKAPVFRPPRRAASDSDIQLDKVRSVEEGTVTGTLSWLGAGEAAGSYPMTSLRIQTCSALTSLRLVQSCCHDSFFKFCTVVP